MKSINSIVILLTFFVFSCTKIEMAVDYAPRFATNSLDRFFDFESERYNKIKETITKDLKNSKASLRDEVLAKIDLMLARADKIEIKDSEFAELFYDAKKIQLQLATFFKPSLTELILNLQDDEFKHFKKESSEGFEKFSEVYKNKDKFKKKALENFERNMKFFFGEASENQKSLYLEFVEQNYSYYAEQMEFRKLFLKRFEEKLPQRQAALDFAFQFYSGDDAIKTAEYKKHTDLFFKNMFVTTQKIWQTLSEKQRNEFKNTLTELKTDLKAIK